MVIPVCVALPNYQRTHHSEFTPLLYITLDKFSVEYCIACMQAAAAA